MPEGQENPVWDAPKEVHGQLCCSSEGSRCALPFLQSILQPPLFVFSLHHTNISPSITVYSHILSTFAWGTQANDCIAGIPSPVFKYKHSFQQ